MLRRASPTLFPYTTLFRSRLTCSKPKRRPGCCNSPGRAEAERMGYTSWRSTSTSRCRGFSTSAEAGVRRDVKDRGGGPERSEEHTSELQSRGHLVCRLLLE